MNLQEMLGESFHEGMTIDEINTALSGKKFADLSTGQYVDKNKFDSALSAKDAELAKKTSELNARLTDSEKDAASREADKARIKELEDLIKAQTASANRDRAESLTNDVKTILDIKENDSDYAKLLDVLSSSDSDTTRSIATYINKIAKESYEKGKKDATKNNLGSFSNGVGKQGSDTNKNEVGSLGKRLAASLKPQNDPNLYFVRK